MADRPIIFNGPIDTSKITRGNLVEWCRRHSDLNVSIGRYGLDLFSVWLDDELDGVVWVFPEHVTGFAKVLSQDSKATARFTVPVPGWLAELISQYGEIPPKTRAVRVAVGDVARELGLI